LRLHDHAALSAATTHHQSVAVVFVFDALILDALEDRDDKRVTFIHESLAEIDAVLRAQGSRLIVLHGDPAELIPRLAQELRVDAVYANHDDEPYAIARDQSVARALQPQGQSLNTFKDHVIFERTEVTTQSGGDFRVYTPYMRAWRARLRPADVAERTVDDKTFWSNLPESAPALAPLSVYGFQSSELWLKPGASGGRERLAAFTQDLPHYGQRRDFPAIEGTSGLSVHLRFGTISIREAVRHAQRHDSAGSTKWLNELIWRDFYQMIMSRFPQAMTTSFKPEYRDLVWPGPTEHLEAWKQGQTGYPIVDAALRELKQTGWMHNRLRMIVASFLTKDLGIDWRRGEAYFAKKLLDFDLAANNGGWQWASSSGCDAQPYFRIFNPVSQSEKFDPQGRFIRRYLPALSPLPNAALHAPWQARPVDLAAAGLVLGRDYPLPIVQHDQARLRTLERYAVVKRPG